MSKMGLSMAYAMAGMLMACDGNFTMPGRTSRRVTLEGAPPQNPPAVIPKGHKLFVIEGVEIYALNQKNAEKKYRRMNRA